VANYKYQYNEEPAPPPPEEVKEYKHYTVYPNNVLIMGIFSLIFSLIWCGPFWGVLSLFLTTVWLGIILALYALQKERIYRREHDGETCKKVRIGKILAIVSLVMAGIIILSSVGVQMYVIYLGITQSSEEVSQLFTYIYPFI